MIRSMVVSAVFAGLLAGLAAALLQQAYVVPVLQQAELYESGALTHFQGLHSSGAAEASAAHSHDHDHGEAAGDAHAHGVGGLDLERIAMTAAATTVTMTGFALLLVAGFAAARRFGLGEVDARAGLLWGLAGFAVFQLAPGAGLAPELPGSAAADLGARQLWWICAVAASAAGAALLVWGPAPAKIVGLALIAAPHLVGAPHPEQLAGVAPPELAALFAARSLAVGAVAWALLGWLAGRFWARETEASRTAAFESA